MLTNRRSFEYRLALIFISSCFLLLNQLYSESKNKSERSNIGVGVMGGLGPAVLGADYEKGSFYSYISGSLLMPFLDFGTSGKFSIGAFSAGVAKSINLTKDSKWKFDVIGVIGPGWFGTFNVSFGMGFGFHTTFGSGFTIGFKIPFFGMTLNVNSNFNSLMNMVTQFYIMNFLGMPIISIGCRF